jgi:AraC family transcriptional activator of pobA
MLMKDVPHYSLYGKSSAADAPHYLYIAHLEESLPKHNWEIHPHRHDQMHQLLVLEEGSVFLQVADWSAEEQGACILSVPAREIHGFRHHPGVRGHIITISEPFLMGAFAETERQAFPFLFTQPLLMRLREGNHDDQTLFSLVRQLVTEYEKPQTGQTCLLGAYLKIIFVLLGRVAGHVQTPEQQFDAKITIYEQFLKLLEEHYTQHWSISRYAERLGMTESRLNRLCQRYTGQNALQIMHGRLVTEAKRKLMYANLSVNEVAYELGFKDPAYFSRFFNKSCGEPPSQFKARMRIQESS